MNAVTPITPAIDTDDTRADGRRFYSLAECEVMAGADASDRMVSALYAILKRPETPEQIRTRREAEMLADMRHAASRGFTNPTVISCERIGLCARSFRTRTPTQAPITSTGA